MIGLETERLVFRQWTTGDFAAVANFFSQPGTAQYVGGVKSPEEAWRLMATYVGHQLLNGFSYLAIDEKISGRLIGTIGLWHSDPWPEPELGYWLLPEAQGQGYGVEAGTKVKAYAKQTLKLDSLVSYIDVTNTASVKLAERLGATYDTTIELLDFGKHQVYRYW